jgi:RsmE family RNA methyltransferase
MEIRVGQIGGLLGIACIESVSDSATVLRPVFTDPPPLPLPVTLVCALPRPKAVRRVVYSAVSMGIKEIFLIGAWKVEKSYWTSSFSSMDSLLEQAMLALEQTIDTIPPVLALRPRFKPFVEDELPSLLAAKSGWLADPQGPKMDCEFGCGAGLLVIGPEGGFTPYESDSLLAAGLRPFRFGSRVLRVETVVPALLGAIVCRNP